jgi:hypothetical protein
MRSITRSRATPSLSGLLAVAFLMLFRDRMKYFALVGGLAFTTFLIVQQLGGFCGLMCLPINLGWHFRMWKNFLPINESRPEKVEIFQE